MLHTSDQLNYILKELATKLDNDSNQRRSFYTHSLKVNVSSFQLFRVVYGQDYEKGVFDNKSCFHR